MKISQSTKNIIHTGMVTIGAAVFGAIIPVLGSGQINMQSVRGALLAGVSAGLSYILKLITAGSSQVQSPPIPTVTTGTDIK